MRKGIKALAVSAMLAASLIIPAGASSFDHCADKLNQLGLFQGTTEGYALDRAPTRAEAAVMLVRMLGKEEEAKALSYTAPFTDLQGWEKPYVQYLYDNGLASGTTATSFSPQKECSAQMYATFLLRALGYSDADGDFTYADAIEYARKLGLVDEANVGTGDFLRDNVAAMSYTALSVSPKGTPDKNLLDKLTTEGAVSADKAAPIQDIFKAFDEYSEVNTSKNASNVDMTAEIKANVTMNGAQYMKMTMPLNIKCKVDLDKLSDLQMSMTGKIQAEVDPALVKEGEESKQDMDIAYYFANGTYYMNMAGVKVKMAMPIEEMMKQLSGITQTGSEVDYISLVESVEKSDNTITIKYSAAGMTDLVETVMGMMKNVMNVGDGGSIKIDNVAVTMTMKDNNIDTMSMSMKYSVTAGGETMGMDMSMDYKVNNTGDAVTVTLPDDLSTYPDMSAIMPPK